MYSISHVFTYVPCLHISLLGVPHIAGILLREMGLVVVFNIIICPADVDVNSAGDPRSKAAINSFAFCSIVGSPKIHIIMSSLIPITILTSSLIFCFYFTFALAIFSASFFFKTPISYTFSITHWTAGPSPAAPGVVET